jgi:hypothetical protein
MRHQNKTNRPLFLTAIIVAFAFLQCSIATADIVLTLPNDFIEKYKNRATIETDFDVRFAHEKPKKPAPAKPANDGDIHVAGVPEELPMPTVAEIINAASQPKALKLVNQVKGSGTPIKITGVWRFWPEHGGDDQFKVGMPIDITNTNPDHVFEIHPTTEVGGIETKTAFFPIPGYKPKDAEDAFTRYENIRSLISTQSGSTSIRMGSIGYNYVKFRLKLREDPTHDVGDGLTVFADVKDTEGETLVRKRRMVFVTGTAPERGVRTLKKGGCMLVLGMPRLSLALVAWRANEGERNPDVLSWSLPYEMVIVADYKDNRCEP